MQLVRASNVGDLRSYDTSEALRSPLCVCATAYKTGRRPESTLVHTRYSQSTTCRAHPKGLIYILHGSVSSSGSGCPRAAYSFGDARTTDEFSFGTLPLSSSSRGQARSSCVTVHIEIHRSHRDPSPSPGRYLISARASVLGVLPHDQRSPRLASYTSILSLQAARSPRPHEQRSLRGAMVDVCLASRAARSPHHRWRPVPSSRVTSVAPIVLASEIHQLQAPNFIAHR